MRYNCEVDGCRSQKTNEKLSFFTLPRDEGRRKKWLDLIGRPDLLNKKLSCHFVCSLHFDKQLIKYKPQLHADAFPSKCLPSKSGSSSGDTDEDNSDKSTQTDISVNDRTQSLCVQTSQENSKNNAKQIKQTKAVGSVKDETELLIAKVYHYFEQEYEELKKTIPGIEQSALSQIGQRTALATGVSETTVAEVLEEEARRSEELRQQTLREQSQARKRPRQDSTETLVVKEEPLEPNNEEPEVYVDLPNVKKEPGASGDSRELADPISIDVKIEPQDEGEEATTSNETPVQRDTTSSKRRKRKLNSEAPPATSASPATCNPPERQLTLQEDGVVKMEIEIEEEGFS